MISVSCAETPLLRSTLRHTGYCRRAFNGEMSFCPPPTPSTTPILSLSSSLASPYPPSSRTSFATMSDRSCALSVTSRMFGGSPNSMGSKSTSGRKPPRLA